MRLSPTILLAMLAAIPTTAQAQQEPQGWQFSLTPYLWLPKIEGQARFEWPPGGGGNPVVEVGPSDWLDLLNFGALASGTARKRRFSVSSDLVYLSLTGVSDGRVISVEDPMAGPEGAARYRSMRNSR